MVKSLIKGTEHGKVGLKVSGFILAPRQAWNTRRQHSKEHGIKDVCTGDTPTCELHLFVEWGA